ncbi:hypothetical protein A2U01_0009206 [Trifolium medium]|uniref:Putative plant transposon protein domain-containing protein n=1 Tax=Trifolium medium TaxID=97028 RepID=A0A392MLC0_9FABA|nr:hypothetical protein [Trifolium medium]
MEENQPKIIKEYTICLEELRSQGFNLQASVQRQGWENYFKMLDGPIYDKLVLEFWKNARVKSKTSGTPEIKSKVVGHSVTITLSRIATAIGCPEEGIDIEKYKYNSGLTANIIKKLYDFSDGQNETTLLKPLVSMWYKILVTNFLPKEKYINLSLNIDKHFLYFLLMGHKISLPLTFLNHMKACIETSKSGRSSSFPTEESSHSFSLNMVVKKARCNRLSECLDTSLGPKFQVDKQTNNSAEASSSSQPILATSSNP